MQEDAGDPESNSNVCNEEPRRRDGRKAESRHRTKPSSQHRAARRPDKLLYTPRAARERLSSQQEPPAEASQASTASVTADSENSVAAAEHQPPPAASPSSPGRHVTERPALPDECLPPLADLTVQEEEAEQESLPEKLDGELMNEVKIDCPVTLINWFA